MKVGGSACFVDTLRASVPFTPQVLRLGLPCWRRRRERLSPRREPAPRARVPSRATRAPGGRTLPGLARVPCRPTKPPGSPLPTVKVGGTDPFSLLKVDGTACFIGTRRAPPLSVLKVGGMGAPADAVPTPQSVRGRRREALGELQGHRHAAPTLKGGGTGSRVGPLLTPEGVRRAGLVDHLRDGARQRRPYSRGVRRTEKIFSSFFDDPNYWTYTRAHHSGYQAARLIARRVQEMAGAARAGAQKLRAPLLKREEVRATRYGCRGARAGTGGR